MLCFMRFLFLTFLLCGWLLAPPAAGAGDTAPVILVLGDSLSAAHGIDHRLGWVSLLRARLREAGLPHRIVNASVSGETTAGGLSRLGPALERHRPAIVILELGANDGLRGLPLAQMRANLQRMIDTSREGGARVLLVGMRLPPNYGPRYTRAFHDVYSQLATANGVPLVPFLLEGVSERRAWMQADNLHPNAQGQPALLQNVWRRLWPLLEKQAASEVP